MTRIQQVGWAPVKGVTWLTPGQVRVDAEGVVGDRAWSPVGENLVCLKATEAPELAGLRVSADELPEPGGDEVTVTYWGRPFPATVHGGLVADRISAVVGQPLRLAHTRRRPGFVWSSPISVVLVSELDGLPLDVGRYRANIVLDDRDSPLKLTVGQRLYVDEVVLEVERRLDRCVVINHDPVTGRRDADLLPLLPTGLVLGFGCRVVRAGRVRVSPSNERCASGSQPGADDGRNHHQAEGEEPKVAGDDAARLHDRNDCDHHGDDQPTHKSG